MAIFAPSTSNVMKKYLVAGLSLCVVAAHAQKVAPKKPVPSKTKTSTAKTGAILKNQIDSVSYAIGYSVADFYHNQQGMKNINAAMVSKAINDVFTSKQTSLNKEQVNLTMMNFMNPNLAKNIAEGEKFLASNKTKAGVKTTASGIQYEVLTQGTGPKPAATDTVTVNYVGTLTNGTEFDNSYKRGEPISFPLNGVIPGWTEALQLMPVGSKYKLYIPYQLAYGMNDNGPIPGGSLLIFEVELLNVKPSK